MYQGPLDIIRRINDEAIQLDQIANDYITHDDEQKHEQFDEEELARRREQRYMEIRAEVKGLSIAHPNRGQEVKIYGDVLTISIHSENRVIEPLSLPPKGPRPVPYGTYRGYAVMSAYNPDTDEHQYGLFHVLQGKTNEFWDNRRWHHMVTEHTYVSVLESEVAPIYPIDAHSMKDLSLDDEIEDFTALAFDESCSQLQKLRQIGSLTNKRLIKQEGQIDKNNQLISYLNSIGLLDGVTIVTRDIAYAESEEGECNVTGISNLSQTVEVKPLFLQSEQSYQRINKNTGVKISSTKELYVNGHIAGNKQVLTPLKSIISVV